MDVNEIATKGDLIQLRDEILQAISKLSDMKGLTNQKWLKSPEVRKMLDISHGSLQTLRINGTLPYTKLGGSLYYDIEDIQKVMEQNKHNVPSSKDRAKSK